MLRRVGLPVVIACAASLVGQADTAHADPIVVAAQARYTHARIQLRRLDRRAEQVAERYDGAKWHLHILRRRITDASRRLQDAEAELAGRQRQLSGLLIEAYKTGEPSSADLILGADSLSQVTRTLEAHTRIDSAFSDAVRAIRRDRDEISHQRVVLVQARRRTRRQLSTLRRTRQRIRADLRRRRRLVSVLEANVTVGLAAERIGQARLALQAGQWIRANQTAQRGDPGAGLRDQVALEGLAEIGVPYKWGGASPQAGFDCSGLTTWLWAKHGVTLPHFAAAQYQMGPSVPKSDLRIGDLVFFHNLGHMGIYIGNGYVLHAPHTGSTVRIDPFSMGWFQSTYVGATRPGPP